VFIEAFKEVVVDATKNIQDSVDNALITKIMTELEPQIDKILNDDKKEIDFIRNNNNSKNINDKIENLVRSKTDDPYIISGFMERYNNGQ
jgi:hypothetical protein